MAIRRTKRNRIKAQSQRVSARKSSSNSQEVTKIKAVDLTHGDTKLIIKDLKKTLVASVIVVGVLVALYIKL